MATPSTDTVSSTWFGLNKDFQKKKRTSHLRCFCTLCLLDLLGKLEFSDPLLHNLDPFGLVNLCGSQELKKKS